MNPQNEYTVIVAERALQQLSVHTAFLAENSPAAAETLVTHFEEALRSLEYMPNRCPWLRGEFIPQYVYRFLIFDKRYLVIFQVADGVVYVDHVVDCRQDDRWLLR